jgi:hypothetical protein
MASWRDADFADHGFLTGRGFRGSRLLDGTRISRIADFLTDLNRADFVDCSAMTTHAWLGFILATGAVLEVPTGLALLLAPSVVAELLLRAPLDGTGQAIARLAGGGLLAVGIACWGARQTPMSAAGRGVGRGFLAYNIIACAVLLRMYAPLPGGLAAFGAGILHGLIAAALLAALYDPGRLGAER